ncbi:MAG: molybdopterin-dependent oxidoreductase [Nitrospinota bacterium]|jgi:anaerobic selenocysteine-containing dehydrogenase|nr:molybdopterin-dependent oxidoreductase [Nitrospinota bacterium]HJM42703.1 molybdopterin-dependent oxidoreductase [Nitrospinota bacterium]
MKTIRTTCALDCQDACGIDADVEDGRVVRLRGAQDHPYTEGFLCIRLNRFLDRLYGPERVTRPRRKTKSGWREIAWDDALDLAAEKFRAAVDEYGSTSILYYMDVGSFGISKQYNIRLFNRLGGPTVASGSLCLGAGLAGMLQSLGRVSGHDPSDLFNSRMIVLWGRNPAAYAVHLVPLIRRERERGIEIVLIDPVRTESAKFCDRHYAPRPGGDGFLALAICKHLLDSGKADQDFLENRSANPEAVERMAESFSWDRLAVGSGLPPETLREIARLFERNHPACILMGKGPQHYRQGTEITRLILAAAAVSGNIGVPGGGLQYSSDFWSPFDRSLMGEAFITKRRTAPKGILGEAILNIQNPPTGGSVPPTGESDLPLRAAFINGGNPVTQCPNSKKVAKALRSIDFVTVVDQFMTDTAECADLFLPCAMFLEERDVRPASWNPYVGPVIPAAAPLDGVKTDWEIIGGLAKRMGVEDPYLGEPVEKLLEGVLAPMAEHGLDPKRAMSEVFRKPNTPDVAFAEGDFSTRSGKFEFLEAWEPDGLGGANGTDSPVGGTDRAEGPGPPDGEDDPYPLNLLSLKDPKSQASQTLESTQERREAKAWLHPETAARFGVKENAEGRLVSAHGSYPVKFVLDDGVRIDVCVARAGGWLKKDRGVNVLTGDILSTYGETPGYYETKVRVVMDA